MSNEWDANIQAINVILDRDRAEIASLKDQLIERLAEINEKDRRIAELESQCVTIISNAAGIAEFRDKQIAELEGQLATALREREG